MSFVIFCPGWPVPTTMFMSTLAAAFSGTMRSKRICVVPPPVQAELEKAGADADPVAALHVELELASRSQLRVGAVEQPAATGVPLWSTRSLGGCHADRGAAESKPVLRVMQRITRKGEMSELGATRDGYLPAATGGPMNRPVSTLNSAASLAICDLLNARWPFSTIEAADALPRIRPRSARLRPRCSIR